MPSGYIVYLVVKLSMLSKSNIQILFFIIFFSSCVNNNEEELYSDCKTDNISYSIHIKPYVDNSCLSCHNSNLSSGGVDYSTSEGLKKSIDDGSFLGSIKHLSSYSAMPPSSPMTDDCKISQIQAWIDQGAENN